MEVTLSTPAGPLTLSVEGHVIVLEQISSDGTLMRVELDPDQVDFVCSQLKDAKTSGFNL